MGLGIARTLIPSRQPRRLAALAVVGLLATGPLLVDTARAATTTIVDPEDDNGAGFDPRGDIVIVNLDYYNDGLAVDVWTRAIGRNDPEYPDPDADWNTPDTNAVVFFDVNGDDVTDYEALVASTAAGEGPQAVMFDGPVGAPSSNRLCEGTFTRYSRFQLTVAFPPSCVGSPGEVAVRVRLAYTAAAWCSRHTSPVTHSPVCYPSSQSIDQAPDSGFGPAATFGTVSSTTVPSSTSTGPRFTTTSASSSTTSTTTTTIPTDPPTLSRRGDGYWMLGGDGRVFAFGDARWYGSGTGPSKFVDLEPTPGGGGYWLVDELGIVTPRGDAAALGGAAGLTISRTERAVSVSATPSGKGYWIFTNLGRALPFGDARFFGDMAGVRLNGAVLGSVATPSGGGYYMVASDGGIFAFGDAAFHGSTGATRLNSPVMSMAPTPNGSGYWLVAADGGIFAFDAPFYGSMGATRLNEPITGMVPSATGAGYLMVAADGGVFSFGDVPFHGSLGSDPPKTPIAAIGVFAAAV